MVKGTTLGTVTDLDGNFTLEVPTGAILVVSYVGYKTQEIKVGESAKTSYHGRSRQQIVRWSGS